MLVIISERLIFSSGRPYQIWDLQFYILLPSQQIGLDGYHSYNSNNPWHYIFRYSDNDSTTIQLVAANSLGNNNDWRYIDTTIKLSDLPRGINTISIERVPPRKKVDGIRHRPVMQLNIVQTEQPVIDRNNVALDYSLVSDSVLNYNHKRFRPSPSKYNEVKNLLEAPSSINVRDRQ